MIEITNTCIDAFMKARNYLVVRCREKPFNWTKTENSKNILFNAPANRFRLTSKLISIVKE